MGLVDGERTDLIVCLLLTTFYCAYGLLYWDLDLDLDIDLLLFLLFVLSLECERLLELRSYIFNPFLPDFDLNSLNLLLVLVSLYLLLEYLLFFTDTLIPLDHPLPTTDLLLNIPPSPFLIL